MVGFSSFGPIAAHYDSLMAGVPYDMWVSYYRLLLAHQQIEPRSALDVCCGTGAITEMLAREGWAMAGVDLSAPMIERARAKAMLAGLDIDYHVSDVAEFVSPRLYDAAYSFFDSLNYIVEPERLAAAIARVGRALPPGGSFVFDLNTAYAFEAGMFDQEAMSSRRKLRYKWKGDYDPASRLIRVHMDFWDGERHFVEEHVQRAHPEEEVRQALENAGFVKVQAFNSYTLDPPRKRSDRVHYAAVRGPLLE